jgi:TIR domain
LPVGQPPEIKRIHSATVVINAGASVSSYATVEASSMKIPSKPELPPKSIPEILVSFAWGDDSSEDAWKRTETPPVRRSGRMAGISRDSKVLRPGDLISGFMERIGLADHVIVVLSDKYLHSPYCMTELHSIYQRSVADKEDFLRRIIPVTIGRRTIRHT